MFSFISDKRCELHENNGFEIKKRFSQLDTYLKKNNYPEIKLDELSEEIILSVHDVAYITKIKELCLTESILDGVDLNKNSYLSILASVNSIMRGIDNLHNNNSKYIFCNIRPPGHHSTLNKGGGNCLVNNIVCGAKYATKYFDKVAIIDWDLHFGNGTYDLIKSCDESFEKIKYYSIHQAGIYPCSKLDFTPKCTYSQVHASEVLDITQYMDIFDKIISDLKEYKPNIILISCGFDSCVKEMFAHNFPLEPADYYILTTKLKSLDVPILSALEGGYDTNTMEECLSFHVKAFVDN